ncbi:MAG: ABC transporter permease subunit [Thermoleophilia bacterium]
MSSCVRFWLRRTWRATAGWTLGLALIVTALGAAFAAAAGTPFEAARFERLTQPLAKTFAPLLGPADRLDTAGGFLTWRGLGASSVILSVFAVLLASRLTLREERRGATDLVLSTPVSRAVVMTSQGIVLAIDCTLVGVAGVTLGWVGATLAGADLSLAGAAWAGLDLGLLALFWGAAAGLLGQFLRTRGAVGGVTAVGMIVAYLVANMAETSANFHTLAYLSPFTAYLASRPLVPGHGVDAGGLLILLFLAVVAWGIASAVFSGRDLAVGARKREGRGWLGVDASRVMRGPATRDLWALRGIALGWAAGFSFFLALFISTDASLRKPIQDFLAGQGALGTILGNDVLGSEPIGVVMFASFVGPALAVFSALQVSRWVGEVDDGLLTAALATSVGRVRLLVSRMAAMVGIAAAALAIAWMAALIAAAASGTTLPPWHLARGMVAALTIVLVFGGFGLAVAALWRSAWAAPLVGALALVNFLLDLVGPLLHWPSWTAEASIFGRLGNAVGEGLRPDRQGVLLALGLALVAVAAVGFRRRDLPN